MARPIAEPLSADVGVETRPERVTTGDVGLGLLLAILTFGTIVVIARPEASFGVVWVPGDLLINEAATIISSIAAVLAFLRYRYIGSESAAYQSAAFALFAVSAAAQTVTSLGFLHDLLRVDMTDPGQAPIYAWTLVRIVAGAFLLQSARVRLRGPDRNAHPQHAIAGTLIAVAIGVIGVFVFEPFLPPLVSAEELVQLARGVDLTTPFPGISGLEVVIGAIAVGLLASAAAAFWIAARRGRYPNGRIMAAGLIAAAFAQLHFTLLPGVYAGLVTTGDLLRLVFYGFVIVSFQRDASAALLELRTANHRLNELREVEVANASLAERARLAREVHDGLAQRLWLAKLTTERLGKIQSTSDVPPIRAELDSLLDAGIDEARQTVVALRDAAQTDVPGGFTELLARETDRFEQRTGITVKLSVTGADERALPPRTAAELLRIFQEALTNIRRHADATVVTVSYARFEGGAELAIRDNGVGFDQSAERHGYGLVSMRERAELVGGRLEVETSPSAGTEVKVFLPLA